MAKVVILCGLPGSGKTRFSNEQASKHHLYHRFDLDRFKNLQQHYEKTFSAAEKNLLSYIQRYDVVYLDGVSGDQGEYELYYRAFDTRGYEIEFVFFEPDINTCLWNNKYRKNVSEILKVDMPHLFKMPNASLVVKTTEKKSFYQLFKDRYSLFDEITSSTWSLGGTWADCWGTTGEVSPDPEPEAFTEFEDLLMNRICPNITLAQYKALYHDLVSIDQTGNSDYYGGYTEDAFFICRTKALYEALGGLGLLDEELNEGVYL